MAIITMAHNTGDINDAVKAQAAAEHIPLTPALMSSAVSCYRKYLRDYYSNESVQRDDKLSIAPCDQFINLALIEKRKHIDENDAFLKTTLHGGVDEILAYKTPLEIEMLLSADSRFVLVEGPPGIGKSTLCWELCRKWETLKSLQVYKIVLLLKLREKRIQEADSLNQLFYHEDKDLCNSVVEEVFRSIGEEVLLIMDGFDEMSSSVVRDKSSLIMRLISGNCLPTVTRLITSRPSALHYKEECFPQQIRHVEILGFTDECKVHFAEFAFRSEPEILVHFKDFMFSNPIINSLMYIPVNCAIIAQVYKDIRRCRKMMPKTMTQLYTTLILVLIRRHMIEVGEWEQSFRIPSSLKELPKKVIKDLKVVSQLAYGGLFADDIKLVFTESDVGESFWHMGLLNEVKEMYVSEGARTSYSFLHLSVQEFLAAWHVSCHPDLVHTAANSLYAMFNCENETPHLRAFGLFFAGLVGFSSFDENMKIDGNHLWRSYVHKCFYEAQDTGLLSSLCDFTVPFTEVYEGRSRYILDSLHSITPLNMDISNPLDAYVFGYTLVYAPIQWRLKMLISFDTLASSIANHAHSSDEIMGSIVGLNIRGEFFNKLETLPLCLRETVVEMICSVYAKAPVPALCKAISLLPRVQGAIITEAELCQDAPLLYRSLRFFSLTKLSFHFKDMSLEGIQELAKTIASSNTLKEVILKSFIRPQLLKLSVQCALHRLMDAILCSPVKSLETNIFFVPTNNATKIEHITLELQACNMGRLCACLCCIAVMCELKSLRVKPYSKLTLTTIPPRAYCEFLAILNDSLHHNTSSMKDLKLSLCLSILSYSNPLAHTLRRDPDTIKLKLRKSKSLCDLTKLKCDIVNGLPDYGVIKLCQSCPDLLELQSLHNIHPLIHYALCCDKLYYDPNAGNFRLSQDKDAIQKAHLRKRGGFVYYQVAPRQKMNKKSKNTRRILTVLLMILLLVISFVFFCIY